MRWASNVNSNTPSPARRILYVHNSADIYGASRSLLRLLGALDRQRFAPIVLLPEEGPLRGRLDRMSLRVLVDPTVAIVTRQTSWLKLIFWYFPKSTFRLLRLIRLERIELVHTNTGVIISPGMAAMLARVPHVWHIRESFDEFPRWLWWVYSRYIQAVSAKVICVSNAIANQFSRSWNVTAIYNGFRADGFHMNEGQARGGFREGFGLARNDFVAACIGRIKFGRKGQEYLVQAVAALRRKSVEVKLLIVGAPSPGSEDHLDQLQTLIAKLDLTNNVILTGEIDDARSAYAACDVLVLPSGQAEPFGGVVVEAMFMKKPVIATNVGGSAEQVIDGETGFLVPPRDAEALAARLLLLHDNPVLRRAMGEAGRRRAEDQFTLEQMMTKLKVIYLELLAA
jgi:glycosyltransferase involved in cell wall biosynthesis